jgi:hypothetical protein
VVFVGELFLDEEVEVLILFLYESEGGLQFLDECLGACLIVKFGEVMADGFAEYGSFDCVVFGLFVDGFLAENA